MKRKKFFKKTLAVCLALGCVMQLAGCGNKGGDDKGSSKDNETDGQKDYVYVAEFQDVDVENLSSSVVKGDSIYYTTGEYNEETEEYKQQVCKLKIGETASETLPIEVEQDTYLNSLQVDEEGNLMVIVNKYSEEEGENLYLLKKYSQDGTELFSYDLTSLGKDEESFYVQYMAEDAKGNIYIGGSESKVWILAALF